MTALYIAIGESQRATTGAMSLEEREALFKNKALRVHSHESNHGETAIEQFRVNQVGDLVGSHGFLFQISSHTVV